MILQLKSENMGENLIISQNAQRKYILRGFRQKDILKYTASRSFSFVRKM